MELTIEAVPMKKQRKQYTPKKLTPEKIQVIEQSLKLGMTGADIANITGVNSGTVSAVRLVLQFVGRL